MTTASTGPQASLLLSRLPSARHEINGVPPEDRARARERAAAIVAGELRDVLAPGGLSVSPLGAAWSTDIDAYLLRAVSPERLHGAGWLAFDGVLERIGSPGRGRWLVMDGDDPLVIADLHVGPPPDPVTAVLRRVRRRGELRLREVLELLALRDAGHLLPAEDRAVRLALELSDGADLAGLPAAVGSRAQPQLARGRRIAGRVRRSRRPRLSIAISGVDGAGKSTLAQMLLDDLARSGVPCERVWTRPGLRIGALGRVGKMVKRVIRDDPAPAVQRLGKGDAPATVRSRRGVMGWGWSFLVTCSFVIDVRRRHLAGRGILLYDRHLLDALATLRFAYGGIDTRLHEAVVRRLVPKVFATFYLDLPAEVAQERKPDEVFGACAVTHQLETYASALLTLPGVHALDALRPPRTLASEVLRALAQKQAA